jgi:two-component system NtrC family sensor kinase
MGWFDRHLSIRETTYALVVVALLTLAIGSAEVILAYNTERQRLESTMNQFFESIADTSARAAYHVDERQAEAVLDGLMKFKSLESAQISTDLGVVLATRTHNIDVEFLDSWANWLFGGIAKQQRLLVFDRLLSESAIAEIDSSIDPDRLVGKVELKASSEIVGRRFLILVGELIIALLLELFLVAAALAYIFHRSLTKPLLQLADDLGKIDPQGTVMTRASMPVGHEKDELGLVVARTNELLQEIFGLHKSEALSRRNLEDSELRFRSIFENAAVGIIELDEGRRIERTNRQFTRMLGYEVDALVGLPLDSLIHGDDIDLDKNLLASLIADEIPTYVVQKRFIRREREIMYGSVTVSAVRELDHSGNLILVVQDMTHGKQQETKIAAQQVALMHRERVAALGSMLAGVAHELNNPLAVVMAQTELLAETADNQETRNRAEKILKPVERCARIVRTFLTLARQRDTRKAYINIEDVISDARELLEYQFRTNNIEVLVNIAPGFPEIWGDSAQISQVLMNLLINSQQALMEIEQDRSIAIEVVMKKEQTITIIVSDNGPGVPVAIQDRIFEPFFTTKPEGQGTGLGLSYCQSVAEGHGGTIEIEKSGQIGTSIRFEIPTGGDQVESDKENHLEGDVSGASLRILVVDDETSLLDSIVEQMVQLGHAADGYSNARQAIEIVMTDVYDIILTDIRMPDLDGPAFYAEVVAKNPQLRDRFIFITGDSLNQRASEFIKNTNAPCLDKPFRISDLNEAITEVVRRTINGVKEIPADEQKASSL